MAAPRTRCTDFSHGVILYSHTKYMKHTKGHVLTQGDFYQRDDTEPLGRWPEGEKQFRRVFARAALVGPPGCYNRSARKEQFKFCAIS